MINRSHHVTDTNIALIPVLLFGIESKGCAAMVQEAGQVLLRRVRDRIQGGLSSVKEAATDEIVKKSRSPDSDYIVQCFLREVRGRICEPTTSIFRKFLEKGVEAER